MAFTLVLNNSNVIGSQNSQFKYNFLAGNFVAKDMEICVGALAFPYSFFNVSPFYNNQSFSLIFPTGATTTTLSITLPAGFYEVSDINNYIQNQCITAGLYLINASNENVYYFNVTLNTTYYAVQIVCSPVPTSLPSGFTLASSGFYSTLGGLPTTGYTPQLVLPTSGGINTIIGFASGTFPSVQQTASFTQLSSVTPIGSTINSLVIRCSIINNNVTIPSDILDAFPINTTFGSNITYDPSFEKWLPISDGTYSNFLISFVDQNLNTISANDPNIALSLLIRKKNL
jgi:hypothetical protein